MKKFFSQKSYPQKLGSCKETIASSGCLLVSLCNLLPRITKFSKDPIALNKYCLDNGLYLNGCLLDLDRLRKKLNLTYERTTTKPKITCIAETAHYKSKGVPQHFFMWKPDGTVIDPLDLNPDWKKNPYKIVSYRVFKEIPKPKATTRPAPISEATRDSSPILEPAETLPSIENITIKETPMETPAIKTVKRGAWQTLAMVLSVSLGLMASEEVRGLVSMYPKALAALGAATVVITAITKVLNNYLTLRKELEQVEK